MRAVEPFIRYILPLFVSGGGMYAFTPALGEQVGNLLGTDIAIGRSVPFIASAVLVPCLVSLISIWLLYAGKYDVSETVKKGIGLYEKFRWIAFLFSLIISIVIVAIIGFMLDYNILFMTIISVIFAFTSHFWFIMFTEIGQEHFSKGSLAYWPKKPKK